NPPDAPDFGPSLQLQLLGLPLVPKLRLGTPSSGSCSSRRCAQGKRPAGRGTTARSVASARARPGPSLRNEDWQELSAAFGFYRRRGFDPATQGSPAHLGNAAIREPVHGFTRGPIPRAALRWPWAVGCNAVGVKTICKLAVGDRTA